MRIALITITAAFALLGCKPSASGEPSAEASAAESAKPSKTVSAELTGYNHTDKTIAAFYVNGQWGGNITPGAGGGKFVCCVKLPRPWHEGYTVTVTWEDHELKTQKREVVVPKYEAEKAGGMNVHFLRSGEIKVFVGMTMLGHPDYPFKGKDAQLKPGVPNYEWK